MSNEKPRLVLLGGRRITAADIARMFGILTGRAADMTPEQLAEVDRQLDQRYAELRRRDDEGQG
jgi:hypothetical protein